MVKWPVICYVFIQIRCPGQDSVPDDESVNRFISEVTPLTVTCISSFVMLCMPGKGASSVIITFYFAEILIFRTCIDCRLCNLHLKNLKQVSMLLSTALMVTTEQAI